MAQPATTDVATQASARPILLDYIRHRIGVRSVIAAAHRDTRRARRNRSGESGLTFWFALPGHASGEQTRPRIIVPAAVISCCASLRPFATELAERMLIEDEGACCATRN